MKLAETVGSVCNYQSALSLPYSLIARPTQIEHCIMQCALIIGVHAQRGLLQLLCVCLCIDSLSVTTLAAASLSFTLRKGTYFFFISFSRFSTRGF